MAEKKKKKRFFQEFKEFISRGSVIDLAVGVIIGAAFTSIVNSLVNDIVNPVIGLLTGRHRFFRMEDSPHIGRGWRGHNHDWLLYQCSDQLPVDRACDFPCDQGHQQHSSEKPEPVEEAKPAPVPVLQDGDSGRRHALPALHLGFAGGSVRGRDGGNRPEKENLLVVSLRRAAQNEVQNGSQ